MHRFLSACLGTLAVLASASVAAQDYRVLDGAQPGNDPETIEVVEFFWYGCPHCHNFEPYIERWKEDKPDGVTFRYVPAVFSPTWELHGRSFYAAQVLGVLDTFHDAMFRALHEQGRRLETESELRAFVDELGLDGDKFVDAMSSFAVDAKIRRARSLQKAYGISGTPSVVIDGRYVTSGGMAGGFDRMIEIINERVAAIKGGSG
ncbi:MAG: thiol:disulfide interchange protein DsbA/DsbL [Halofilum sp. (in: g-proteobacteria)]|nr:thiol:disulfide interchange protein DsbA/DsbL [Halofilum sp. (in: g-proteobacteria)]